MLSKMNNAPGTFCRSSPPGRAMITNLLIAGLVLFSGSACAHSWYPEECCHDDDCRPVPCVELRATSLGLMWRDAVIFNETQTRDSQDQRCHVCVKSFAGFVSLPICVFVPHVIS